MHIVPVRTARDAARIAYCIIWTASPDTPMTIPYLVCSRKKPRISWSAGDRKARLAALVLVLATSGCANLGALCAAANGYQVYDPSTGKVVVIVPAKCAVLGGTQ